MNGCFLNSNNVFFSAERRTNRRGELRHIWFVWRIRWPFVFISLLVRNLCHLWWVRSLPLAKSEGSREHRFPSRIGGREVKINRNLCFSNIHTKERVAPARYLKERRSTCGYKLSPPVCGPVPATSPQLTTQTSDSVSSWRCIDGNQVYCVELLQRSKISFHVFLHCTELSGVGRKWMNELNERSINQSKSKTDCGCTYPEHHTAGELLMREDWKT